MLASVTISTLRQYTVFRVGTIFILREKQKLAVSGIQHEQRQLKLQ